MTITSIPYAHKNSTILILNARPGVGKDTIAQRLEAEFSIIHRKFKDILTPLVKAFYGISDEGFDYISSPENKNRIVEPFDLSYRDMMIHVAENTIKPVLGKNFFAKNTIEGIDRHLFRYGNSDFVISDCGFEEELDELVRYFDNGDVIIKMVSIIGDDSGVNDSRINLTDYACDLGIPNLRLNYHKDEESLRFTAHKIYNWMKTDLIV
jgi:hypothetical protein